MIFKACDTQALPVRLVFNFQVVSPVTFPAPVLEAYEGKESNQRGQSNLCLHLHVHSAQQETKFGRHSTKQLLEVTSSFKHE